MRYSDHGYESLYVIHLIQYTVITLPYAIPLLARELLAAGRTGIVAKCVDSPEYAAPVLRGTEVL